MEFGLFCQNSLLFPLAFFAFFPNAIKPLGYVYDYVKDVDVTLGNKTTTLVKRK